MHNLACKSLDGATLANDWPFAHFHGCCDELRAAKRYHSRHVLGGHSFAEMKFLERSYLTAVKAGTSCISLYFMYLIHSCEFYPRPLIRISWIFSFSFLWFVSMGQRGVETAFANFTCVPTYVAFLLESFDCLYLWKILERDLFGISRHVWQRWT